jgi:DDE superfamily endonuclease
MQLPNFAMPVLSTFQPAFSTPTSNRFLVLWLGAILTTGRQTLTNIVRTVRHHATGHVSSYHRVFSQRRWSAWELARLLLTFLLNYVVPTGPVLLAGDDTIAERPGPHVFGQGRHRDGVRSTHSYTAYRWGHQWVVVSVLVTFPFAARPWALQVWVASYRDPGWDQAHGRRHNTPAHLARLLLACLVRWFPERQFIFVGDTGCGTSETARFCRQQRRHLTLVSKFYGAAALYEPPPPRHRGGHHDVCEGSGSPHCLTEGQKSSSETTAETLPEREHNVSNVGTDRTQPTRRLRLSARQEELVEVLEEQFEDTHSRGAFCRIVSDAGLGEEVAARLLGETLERERAITGPLGAYFIAACQREAQRQGIDLGFKGGRRGAFPPQTWPRPTLLVNSKIHGQAVFPTKLESQRDQVCPSSNTHSHGVGN